MVAKPRCTNPGLRASSLDEARVHRSGHPDEVETNPKTHGLRPRVSLSGEVWMTINTNLV